MVKDTILVSIIAGSASLASVTFTVWKDFRLRKAQTEADERLREEQRRKDVEVKETELDKNFVEMAIDAHIKLGELRDKQNAQLISDLRSELEDVRQREEKLLLRYDSVIKERELLTDINHKMNIRTNELILIIKSANVKVDTDKKKYLEPVNVEVEHSRTKEDAT